MLALPQRPYFPLGTLRQALTYPTLAEEVDDTQVREAMAAAGLGHLAGGSTRRPNGARCCPAASSSASASPAR